MGPITLMAQYGDRDHDLATGANDMTRWTLGVGYALSKRTNVYAAYNDDNNDIANTDVSIFTVGMNHSF